MPPLLSKRVVSGCDLPVSIVPSVRNARNFMCSGNIKAAKRPYNNIDGDEKSNWPPFASSCCYWYHQEGADKRNSRPFAYATGSPILFYRLVKAALKRHDPIYNARTRGKQCGIRSYYIVRSKPSRRRGSLLDMFQRHNTRIKV